MFGIFSPMIARTPSAKVDGTKNHAPKIKISIKNLPTTRQGCSWRCCIRGSIRSIFRVVAPSSPALLPQGGEGSLAGRNGAGNRRLPDWLASGGGWRWTPRRTVCYTSGDGRLSILTTVPRPNSKAGIRSHRQTRGTRRTFGGQPVSLRLQLPRLSIT